MRSSTTFLAVALFLSACGDGDDPAESDVSRSEAELLSANGISTNGISTNGISTNGISTNGISTNGTSLSGVTLVGTKFSGTSSSGQPISGAGFVGAQFNATRTDGTTYKLRIDSAQLGTGANSDVWYYRLSWLSGGTTWRKLCGLDTAGVQIPAIPLNGVWDYRSGVVGGGAFTPSTTSFTFSCRDATMGKCVELGYKPWKSITGGTMVNHHVACVRMLRADYCGDGKTWTKDGQQVNLYDGIGVQADTAAWGLEAEWTENGARCITATTNTRTQQRLGVVPLCFPTLISTSCGQLSRFGTGTRLMTEVP